MVRPCVQVGHVSDCRLVPILPYTIPTLLPFTCTLSRLVVGDGGGLRQSQRECVAGAAIWLCLSASEVEELQNPLLIARPAGFRCLARHLGPSGRSRVSQGLTHRLRDDLGGRRGFHVMDSVDGLIMLFRLSVDHAHCCPALSPPCPCGSSRASIGLCIDAPLCYYSE